MSDDLWGFLMDIPSGGYTIDSSYCTGDGCNHYTGNIEPKDIWKFDLISSDGKPAKKFEARVTDLFEPRICLSVDDSDKKVDFDISPENCNVTKDGLLCVDGNNQDHKLRLLIKKY
ncbi:hypothetical protein [Wolbachia endosymbiont of Ctenocephalides felis wCfeJ]|uniref:hypothetical protein n=1 Tax=Wolbachia endosymbiont of Ctenocephalides felis wCfeJ TaxID=2732594 RepID=UPI001445CB86|nr:hypothetical protein [Wolbachia endosymbiont of Ctenocephalides felis wCfeJ]WCR58027.1 MAG: hypothetical protein PG980_000499 [Wolbachia endosymbiont of Ctenocephalides felis wCfeJ]